ncbi:MAG: tyrosine-type recombinase/integrase [Planctomycetota bacterium]
MAHTGLRAGEARSLRWRHIDLSDRMAITLPAKITKSRRTQVIPLSKRSIDAITALRESDDSPSGPVFGALDDKTLRRDLHRCGVRIVEERGLSSGFHSFRKYYATALARAGVDPM